MIDTTSWKKFRISDLFRLENGKNKSHADLPDGTGYFYVGAKKDENGVMFECGYDDSLISKGNSIVFICNGQGSVGYSNYMDRDFIATADVVVGYNDHLNEYIGLFLVTVIDLERPKYSFGRKWKTHLAETEIKLPINQKGEPDWQFMEDFIKEKYKKVEKKTITKIKTEPNSLDVSDWTDFKILDLFDIELSKGDLKVDNCAVGNVPLISSGETNNGCVGLIDSEGDGKAVVFDSNKITVDMFCNAFYQEHPFFAVSHGRVNILTPKFSMNKYIALFITTLINHEKFRFAYGRAVYSNVISGLTIKLPTNSKGTIDWQFMENYIKSLPYSDLI